MVEVSDLVSDFVNVKVRFHQRFFGGNSPFSDCPRLNILLIDIVSGRMTFDFQGF